jgi:archaellum biogenesis protein FlaJ (TadC family)
MTIANANTNAMNGEVHEPVFDLYKKLKQRLETTKSHKEFVQVRPSK